MRTIRMKLCVDCKFYLRNNQQCENDSWTNPVDGRQIYSDAMQVRFSSTKCGQDAKWFAENIATDADLDDLSTIPFGR